MVDEEANFFTIFSPHYLERAKRVQEQNLKFVQYTSAEAAANILRTEEVWLRNAQCMKACVEPRSVGGTQLRPH